MQFICAFVYTSASRVSAPSAPCQNVLNVPLPYRWAGRLDITHFFLSSQSVLLPIPTLRALTLICSTPQCRRLGSSAIFFPFLFQNSTVLLPLAPELIATRSSSSTPPCTCFSPHQPLSHHSTRIETSLTAAACTATNKPCPPPPPPPPPPFFWGQPPTY